VFIPGGWWHAVLNLEDTTAVTHNFVSFTNFPKVWKETRTGRKHMAKRWLSCLEKVHPSLSQIAHQLNHKDQFQWNFSDKKKHKEQKRSRSEKSQNEMSTKSEHKKHKHKHKTESMTSS